MDNTVGSLTQYQKSIIIGSILGDGYIRKIRGRSEAFLEINHSVLQQNYVDWKYKALASITKSAPKKRFSNEGRIAYRFFTKQHAYLSYLLKVYYRNHIKIIPGDLNLNPLILAVWYMDDGSMCRKRDVYLNTEQFSIEDQLNLLKYLEKIGLQARLNKDKEYFRIRFLKESLQHLKFLILPHIIPSMRYKIEL